MLNLLRNGFYYAGGPKDVMPNVVFPKKSGFRRYRLNIYIAGLAIIGFFAVNDSFRPIAAGHDS